MKVVFDEGGNMSSRSKKITNSPLTRFIIKYSYGLVKTKKGAEVLMVLFFIFSVSVSLYLFFATVASPKTTKPIYYDTITSPVPR